MPRGTAHELVGLLLRDGQSLVLRIDDGGAWRLDAPGRAWRLLGRRVRVTGTRDGFDLLAARSIDAEGQPAATGRADPSSGIRITAQRMARRLMSVLFSNRSQR